MNLWSSYPTRRWWSCQAHLQAVRNMAGGISMATYLFSYFHALLTAHHVGVYKLSSVASLNLSSREGILEMCNEMDCAPHGQGQCPRWFAFHFQFFCRFRRPYWFSNLQIFGFSKVLFVFYWLSIKYGGSKLANYYLLPTSLRCNLCMQV